MEVKGLGFIEVETGRLRTEKELVALESEATREAATLSDSSLRSALSSVRARTSLQISNLASALNTNVSNLQEARDSTKELRDTAQTLRQAIRQGDEDQAAALRTSFEEALARREGLQAKIAEDNNSRDAAISVRFGNQTRATISISPVETRTFEDVDTSDIRSINAFIADTKDELDSIRTQLDQERAERKELRALSTDFRKEVNGIIRDSEAILNASQAITVSNQVATQILSQATLEDTVVSAVQTLDINTLLGTESS